MKNKMEESKVMTESCTQLNKKAYVNLIDKDLEVLELLPYSIEKNHIEAILRASINHYYPDQESHITKLEAELTDSKKLIKTQIEVLREWGCEIEKLEARNKELEEALESCVNFIEELSELKIAQNWSGLDHIKELISKET